MTIYKVMLTIPNELEPRTMRLEVTVDVPRDYIIENMAHNGLYDLYGLNVLPDACAPYLIQDKFSREVWERICQLDEAHFRIADEWAKQLRELMHTAWGDDAALDYRVNASRFRDGDDRLLEAMLDYYLNDSWRRYVASKYNTPWLHKRFKERLLRAAKHEFEVISTTP